MLLCVEIFKDSSKAMPLSGHEYISEFLAFILQTYTNQKGFLVKITLKLLLLEKVKSPKKIHFHNTCP